MVMAVIALQGITTILGLNNVDLTEMTIHNALKGIILIPV